LQTALNQRDSIKPKLLQHNRDYVKTMICDVVMTMICSVAINYENDFELKYFATGGDVKIVLALAHGNRLF